MKKKRGRTQKETKKKKGIIEYKREEEQGLFTGSFVTLFSAYIILAHFSGMFSSTAEAGYIETVYPVLRWSKESIRERMVVEQVNLDYVPGEANDKHDPKPH